MRMLPLLAVPLALFTSTAAAQTSPDALTPGTLRSYSTLHSIGVEWDVTGDADHDASANVQYRVRGASAWQSALPLVRVDYNGSNMLAGSVLFLQPNTDYDVSLALSDPDGGSEARQIIVRTRPVPAAPSSGRVLHVIPGAGGGDGSLLSPFAGVAAAQAAAVPGDTFLLHAGDYGGRIRFDRAGTATSYIVWKAAGDGEVLLRGIDVAASHLWLEGLTVRDLGSALLSANSPTNVVVTRCQFLNNAYAIFLQGAGSNWYIADNTIVGNTPATSGSLDGEGIDLNVTSGHTVAHNSITNVADGISYPHTNVDMFGNDIFDCSDDGLELDNGRANVRVWGNRVHNAVHNGISFQPQSGGPWYIVRNQIVGSTEAALKFRTTDRFVLLHNTIVHWGDAWPGTSMMCCNEWDLLRAYARNNLWISVQGGQIWGFETHTRDWRTDLDYDGFDWGSSTEPFTYEGFTYPDVWSFSSASGLEANAIRVSHSICFSDFQVPGPSPMSVPRHVMALQPTCEAVDSGVILPNINDDFSGSAPDRGAHEYGHATATYGPRPAATPPPAAPTGLTATAATAQINLQWADQSSNEAGFFIERSSAGQPFAFLASVAPDTGTYSDTSAAAGTQYSYRVAAYNDGGRSPYSNTASATIPASAGVDEIVLYAAEATTIAGQWQLVTDASAATGRRVQNPNAGAAKLATALAAPTSYFELTFNADAGRPYRLWMRGKATSNSWANDSVFIQFDKSVTQAGAPVYRIGTTSATAYTLEDCTSCGVSGWGWQDNGFGAGVLGPAIYFAASGPQRIRIQVREDGLGIDQVVLSAVKYLTSSPGALKNDTTILARTGSGDGDPANVPPAVRITSPVANATFTAPATISIVADASDSDGSISSVEFFANGTRVGIRTAAPWTFTWSGVGAGSYSLTARATDNLGATTTSAAVPMSVAAASSTSEIVLYARTATIGGGWTVTAETTAAGGARLQNPNLGAAKLTAPLASPTKYFELTFTADAGKPYRLWIRGKATSNSWANDSVYVQFDKSVTQSGTAIYRIGTTSATTYTLEDCVGCGVSLWGWQDNGFGTSVLGPAIYFASSGPQRIRIQVREDGLGIDQVVLSAVKYLSTAPGALKNDTTILPASQ